MNQQLTAPEPSERASHARIRLHYAPAFPCHIGGDITDRNAALTRIAANHAEAIEALRQTESRNRETETDRPLQPYYCIGCDITEGTLRAQVLGLGAYPLLQAAMVRILNEKLTLQCYFPQTYEDASGLGPGGILGTLAADTKDTPNTSAARCLKYWNWVSDGHPVTYKTEDEARIDLWRYSFHFLSEAKHWLMQQVAVPNEGIPYPQELSHQLHALLGVAAMRNLAADKMGRNWVLLNAHRVTLAENLHWSQAA